MTVRRLGLIGDVHAEHERLGRALALLREEGADAIACAGDIVDGPGDVDRCVELLAEHGAITVRGNHERWLLRGDMRDLPDAQREEQLAAATRAWIAALPAMQWIETAGGRVLLCHGIGADDMAGVMPWDSALDLELNHALRALGRISRERIVINGHTHRRMVRRVFGGRVIVNAGTIYREHEPCVGLLDLEADTCRFWQIGAGLAVSAAEVLVLPA